MLCAVWVAVNRVSVEFLGRVVMCGPCRIVSTPCCLLRCASVLDDRMNAETLASLYELGRTLQAKGDRTAAEPLYRSVLEIRERTLGPDHRDTLTSVRNLATARVRFLPCIRLRRAWRVRVR